MQITPATARYIARTLGRHAASPSRTSPTPQVNIAYGSYYLRYLLDRYGGNEVLALAAYNAGRGQRRPLDRAGRDARAARSTRRRDPVRGDARTTSSACWRQRAAGLPPTALRAPELRGACAELARRRVPAATRPLS